MGIKQRAWALAVVLCAGLFGAACASAAPITIAVSGRLTSVDAGLAEAFSVGQGFTFVYSFDSETPDIGAGPLFGTYRNGVTDAVLSLAGRSFSAHSGTVGVMNDNGGFDRFSVTAPVPGSDALGPAIGGRFPYFVGIELTDSSGTALNSDELPLGAPVPADYDVRAFELAFATEFNSIVAFGVQRVYGIVTDSYEVPAPATALLLLPLLPLVFRRLIPRRSRQQHAQVLRPAVGERGDAG